MLTITEWANLNPTPLTSGVVQIFSENNAVLAMLPFANIAGNAYTYNQEAMLPGIAFRSFNEGYVESTGLLNPQTEKLTILGGDSDFDVAQIAMGVGTTDTRATYDAMKAKALTHGWLDCFINGDSGNNSKSFDGLRRRLGGDRVMTAGTNGAPITFAMLDELCDMVTGGPTALLVRPGVIRQYRALLRTTYGTTPESVMIPNFGQQVIAHNGIPMIPVGYVNGYNLTETMILRDEPQGTATNTSSIYAVKIGMDALHGIQTAPVSVRDLGEIDAKPAYRTRIEWYSGIVLKHPRCAARLKGVIAP